MKKLMLLIAGGVGYVLGAKAGRGRYEQLRESYEKVKNDPRVQEAFEAAGLFEAAKPTIAEGETLADLLADRSAYEDFDADASGEGLGVGDGTTRARGWTGRRIGRRRPAINGSAASRAPCRPSIPWTPSIPSTPWIPWRPPVPSGPWVPCCGSCWP